MHYLILPMLLSLIVWSLFVVKAFHKYETAAKRDADRRLKKQNQVAAAATATTATAATAAVADTTDAADTAAAAATTETTMIAASAASQSEPKGNWKGLLSSRVLCVLHPTYRHFRAHTFAHSVTGMRSTVL